MSSISCPKCDLTTWATAINCKRCGHFFQTVETAAQDTQSASTSFQSDQNASANQPGSFSQNANQQNFQNSQYQPNLPPPNYNYQSGFQNRYQPPYQSPKLKIKTAVYALIFGILSFPVINVIIGVILCTALAIAFGSSGAVAGLALTVAIMPLGLITGISALRKANKMPQEYGGKGLAITGIVLSAFGLLVVPLVAAVAIPNVLAARRAANEASAVSNIRTLASAEEVYRVSQGKGRCGDLQKLVEAKLIKGELSNGKHNGYLFLIVNLPTLNGDCEITATPQSTSDGDRSFYFSTEDGVIRAARKNGQPANSNDSPIDDNSDLTNKYPKIAGR